MLLLFNQKTRHTALRAIANKVRAQPRLLHQFEAAMADPALEANLAQAQLNPTTPVRIVCRGRAPGRRGDLLCHGDLPRLWMCMVVISESASSSGALSRQWGTVRVRVG